MSQERSTQTVDRAREQIHASSFAEAPKLPLRTMTVDGVLAQARRLVDETTVKGRKKLSKTTAIEAVVGFTVYDNPTQPLSKDFAYMPPSKIRELAQGQTQYVSLTDIQEIHRHKRATHYPEGKFRDLAIAKLLLEAIWNRQDAEAERNWKQMDDQYNGESDQARLEHAEEIEKDKSIIVYQATYDLPS